MSTQQLKAAATAAGTGVAKREEPKTFPAFLEAYKGEIAKALPKHLNPDRMARIALTQFRKNKALGNCTPKSVFAAVIMGSQLGLEPGILGQSFLVPYGRECQFVPGWQGLTDLVSRTGRASAWTGAVFDGDQFDYQLGDRPFCTHRPMGENDPRKMTHVYAIGRVNGAEWPIIEVWPIRKVWQHRDKFNKVGNKHYSFENPEMYARKVPLLQVIKYLPKSVELATALDLETAAETGGQRLDPHEVIDGSWTPVETDEPAESDAVPHFGKESAIAELKKASTADDLDAAWSAIVEDYTQTKREVEKDVADVYSARKTEFAKS